MLRPVATDPDNEFTISIEEAADLYARAGHARTLRSLQRYCSSGHLECTKMATTLGDKYFVTRRSIDRHLAQIQEMMEQARTTGRDPSRQAASGSDTVVAVPIHGPANTPTVTPASDTPRQPVTTSADAARHDATGRDRSRDAAYIEHLEEEKARLIEDRSFLREQIKQKDEVIGSLLERDHETNVLVGQLQRMLAPLLGAPRTDTPTPPQPSDPFKQSFEQR